MANFRRQPQSMDQSPDPQQKLNFTSQCAMERRPERSVISKAQGGSRSKFVIRPRKEAFFNTETNNNVFVPKTVTGGSTIKPNGFARRMAETRSQDMLSMKKPPKSIRSDQQSRKRPSTEMSRLPLSSPENGAKETESVDSGIARGEKGTSNETKSDIQTSPSKDGRESSTVSHKSSNKKGFTSNVKHRSSGKTVLSTKQQSSKAKDPIDTPDLQKEDSGLRSNESLSPRDVNDSQQEKGLFYDKMGNLILRDRKLNSVMSDPVRRKHNTEDELNKIYVEDSSLLVARGDKLRKKKDSRVERPETILSRREANVWDSVHGIYGQDVQRSKKKRHNRFLSKLEQVQLDAAKEHNQKVIESKNRSLESKQRQQVQLWLVRNRFQEEQEKRFYSQWVTMKSLQHEKCDRHVYGLPEDLFGEPEYAARLNRKQPKLIKTFDYKKKRERNKDAYKHLLDINAGVDFDKSNNMPKVEPPNNVDVNVRTHSGVRWKEDEKKVKEILRDAKQELRTEVSTPSPVEKKTSQKRVTVKPPQQISYTNKSTPYKPPPKPTGTKENNAPLKAHGRSNIKFVNPRDQKPKEIRKPSSPRDRDVTRNTLHIPHHTNRERRVPSLASLRTVDFMNDGASDTGSQLDAFEKARIKYNLYMDSDADSVA